MERNDDQPLWDLLGRKTPPEVSPFFARNVLRQIRTRSTWRDSVWAWFRPRRLIPIAGVAAVLIAGTISLHHSRPGSPAISDSDPIAKIDPQDFDVVADLDNLLATEDTSLWDDDNSSL